jgi:hypothetical protein
LADFHDLLISMESIMHDRQLPRQQYKSILN